MSLHRKRTAAVWLLAAVSVLWPAAAANAADTSSQIHSQVVTRVETSSLHPHRSKTLWFISIPVFVAANIADAQSSWSRPEANSLLRGPAGRFDTGSAVIKFSISSGMILGQYSLIRMFKNNDELQNAAYAASAWSNLLGAGVLSGAAVQNYRQSTSPVGSSIR